MQPGKIIHLVSAPLWERALQIGRYSPASLKTEGFIHCSTPEQVLESARIHFPDTEVLVALILIAKHFKATLRWEPGRNGEDFPHIYGHLPLEKVESTRLLYRQPDGNFEWE